MEAQGDIIMGKTYSMYRVGIFTIAIILLYLLKIANINQSSIDIKIKRGLISTTAFSLLGIYVVYNLKANYSNYQVLLLLFTNIVIMVNIVGLSKKRKTSLILVSSSLFISIYGDNVIEFNTVSPLLTFAIYLKSIVYLDIIWDVLLPIFSYHRNYVNNENLNKSK